MGKAASVKEDCWTLSSQRLEQVTILQRREKGLELSPPLKRIGVELPSKVTAKNQENNFLSFDEHNYKGIMAEVWPGMCTPPTDGSGWSALLCPKFSIYLGGISEQSLPSPKKRRPSCRLWSGDARESRKKRGFGCAPCPWLAEAGGSAVQSSLPPTDRRRPFVSRDERRCEAVAAEVWPGMRTTPSDGPGRWDLRAKLAVAQEEKTFLSFVERRREGIPQEAWLRVRPVPVAR
nr:uncharacterized protein LOC102150068 isoform X12 [Equus caballus]XP_023507643.1 uncharacterized protein LOC102150068 isoform X12 [Equus caballus]XP_023507647.1 uncharacterized protein LOC102150068 isoform X12 [Equus caballus]